MNYASKIIPFCEFWTTGESLFIRDIEYPSYFCEFWNTKSLNSASQSVILALLSFLQYG